jgi:hypothetical protein
MSEMRVRFPTRDGANACFDPSRRAEVPRMAPRPASNRDE